MTRDLTYPDRLEPVGTEGARRWTDPAVDFRLYDRILIEGIRVRLDADSPAVDAATLKSLTDYFHQGLVKALQPPYAIVDKVGAGVLRMRITLVDLVATKPEMSVVVLVTPYATIPDLASATASGRPPGSPPYLGRTGIAAEFIDGATDQVVAQYVDVQFRRKYVLDANQGIGSAATKGRDRLCQLLFRVGLRQAGVRPVVAGLPQRLLDRSAVVARVPDRTVRSCSAEGFPRARGMAESTSRFQVDITGSSEQVALIVLVMM
ncbi:MAG: DUF3313 domain-containing protein [Betaproteobacteria bacterium]|nr:DUF3313 domain-containing protein [Betaproteobacteria bacterium]